MIRVRAFYDFRRLKSLRKKQYRSAAFPLQAYVYFIGSTLKATIDSLLRHRLRNSETILP